MFGFACECISQLLNRLPSVQNILDANAVQTVCTNTQCFTTPQEAGFGAVPPSPDRTLGQLVTFGMLALSMLVWSMAPQRRVLKN